MWRRRLKPSPPHFYCHPKDACLPVGRKSGIPRLLAIISNRCCAWDPSPSFGGQAYVQDDNFSNVILRAKPLLPCLPAGRRQAGEGSHGF